MMTTSFVLMYKDQTRPVGWEIMESCTRIGYANDGCPRAGVGELMSPGRSGAEEGEPLFHNESTLHGPYCASLSLFRHRYLYHHNELPLYAIHRHYGRVF